VGYEIAYIFHSEFDFRVVGDGRSATARYANNSNYRNDSLIRKESMHFVESLTTGLLLGSANLSVFHSVCELPCYRRDQADHQGQRNHEVCGTGIQVITELVN